jgi:type IV secretory pathway VirB10-like protein
MTNMKYLLIVIAFFFNAEAKAQVYKCKNEKGKITYQSSPCQNDTGGKLWIMPGPPIEEQMREQAKVAEMEARRAEAYKEQRLQAEKAQEAYDKKKLEEKIEAEKKQEQIRKMEAERRDEIRRQQALELERYKLRLMERQARAAEEAAFAARQAAQKQDNSRV